MQNSLLRAIAETVNKWKYAHGQEIKRFNILNSSFSFLLLCKKLPPTKWLKMIQIYNSTVSAMR